LARLQLITRSNKSIEHEQHLDRTGQPARINLYRIFIQLGIIPSEATWRKKSHVPESRIVSSIIDTGSPISVFHYETWHPYRSEIRWLTPLPKDATQTLTVLGGKWPYRLGRIRIAAFDDAGGWIPPIKTLALFLEDSPGCPSVNILGLRSPFLEHRQLRHAGSDARDIPQWFLEDAPASL
jgi:hypothetical protein